MKSSCSAPVFNKVLRQKKINPLTILINENLDAVWFESDNLRGSAESSLGK